MRKSESGMKRNVIAVALMLLGAGLAGLGRSAAGDHSSWLLLAAGGVLLAGGAMALLTSLTGDAVTFLRLDHFFQFLNQKWQPARFPGPLGGVLRCLLPKSFFFDPQSGRQGHVRRFLRWLGPSVVSSPFRRVIQGTCFALFLYLFFHVCWPYHARPAPAGATAVGWRLAGVDEATGLFNFAGTAPLPPVFQPGHPVHVTAESAPPGATNFVTFVLAGADADTVRLRPKAGLTPEQFDAFLLGTGAWSLHETPPGRWPSHHTDNLAAKERVAAEFFLILDPLVSLSTGLAARSWVWSLTCAGMILLVCVLIPRGFCGYLCPLGSLIDLFDWAIGKRVRRFRVGDEGWWVHIKYYLLAAILICAVFGVLVSGVFSAIPVITRGMLFLGEPVQTGLLRGWHLIPPLNAGHYVSIALFLGVLALGLLRPRFWCKYVCPSGAVFSVANLFRATERKVEDSCINCNKCVEICPFDAIKPDYTTRETDCTLCQTCGGVCPSHSIKFVERWNTASLKATTFPAPGETVVGRRGFMELWAGLVLSVVGGATVTSVTKAWGAKLSDPQAFRPVRPPGSVPEQEFLQMCIRCGECYKACPNNVLQSQGFQQGFEGLWTPVVNADWAGCESSCNACGQVCPTGAIRALPLEEKRHTRMGLAIVNESTCLPFANREACQLCVDECNAAGYRAIEFRAVHTLSDALGNPVPDTGHLAPVVLADKCVGCGLCQTRCNVINVKDKGLLKESAIIIEAGEGREDRVMAPAPARLATRTAGAP